MRIRYSVALAAAGVALLMVAFVGQASAGLCCGRPGDKRILVGCLSRNILVTTDYLECRSNADAKFISNGYSPQGHALALIECVNKYEQKWNEFANRDCATCSNLCEGNVSLFDIFRRVEDCSRIATIGTINPDPIATFPENPIPGNMSACAKARVKAMAKYFDCIVKAERKRLKRVDNKCRNGLIDCDARKANFKYETHIDKCLDNNVKKWEKPTARGLDCPFGLEVNEIRAELFSCSVKTLLDIRPRATWYAGKPATVLDTARNLEWEKKTEATADLHDVSKEYAWAGRCAGDAAVLCQPNTAASATCTAQNGTVLGCGVCGLGQGVCEYPPGVETTIWDWINQLNDGNFGGHADWRLPTISGDGTNVGYTGERPELETIVDVALGTCGGGSGACISPVFEATAEKLYWTGQPYQTGSALGVPFASNSSSVSVQPMWSGMAARAVRDQLTPDTSCPKSPLQGSSIVIFDRLNLSATDDMTLSLRNTANNLIPVHCFYASRSSCGAPLVEFDLVLTTQETRTWQAKIGNGVEIPAAPVPFEGELVCVGTNLAGTPTAWNSIVGTSQVTGECPVEEIGLLGEPDLGDGNNNLDLGGIEYDSCPSTIPAAHIETCWSNSAAFNFSCN